MAQATHDPQAYLQSLGLSADERALLQRFGFDSEAFVRNAAALKASEFPPERNQVRDAVEPPEPGDLTSFPAAGSSTAQEDEARGREAVAQGQVAVAILNGGMATRFGGRVKGVVEVMDGTSFLGLRLGDVARAPGPVTTFLMNSFATEADTLAHLAEHRTFGLDPKRVHSVCQRISIRLTPQGEVFRDDRGRASFYAPGHGDLFDVLAAAPSFLAWREGGGRVLMVSNVDNLGATLSHRVIGAHLRSGKRVTVEVAPRGQDTGGAPVRHRGRVEVLEGFRFPRGFDLSRIPVFNTNTMILDASAVHGDYKLTWFRADKTVDNRQAVQFERLMGEVTAFEDATYLTVPRDGPDTRFLPVKTPDDLAGVRPAARELYGLVRKTHN